MRRTLHGENRGRATQTLCPDIEDTVNVTGLEIDRMVSAPNQQAKSGTLEAL